MLEEIKKELIDNPQALKEILEHFEYNNIIVREKYIQFGRDEFSSKKSIVIKLINNKYLYVHDYPRNIQQDFFTYIINQRHVEFIDILNVVKSTLHIIDYYDFFNKGNNSIFGGFYKNIRSKSSYKINVYGDEILNKYQNHGNLRFLQDNISLEAQKYFGIRYDIESQGIVIPVRDQVGQLMGVKIRCNWDVKDGEQKYFYIVPCAMSMTLYGYSQNYEYLVENTIYIFEAEKSVLQCYSYGIRNCVALGSGTISKKQIEMILELNPKKIIFCHDVGFELENIMRNINMLNSYSRFAELEIGYWNYFNRGYSNKISPSDLGGSKLKYILNNEIKTIGDETDEEL